MLDMTMSDIDMDGYIDKWSWKREEFLAVFSHPQWGDPTTATFMLHNDSYWKVNTN